MILIKMTLHSALTGHPTQLAEIKIVNKGRGDRNSPRGDYHYVIRGKSKRVMKRGDVLDWPRKARHPIALLQHVINQAYP